ncbi:hypothetical protein [Bacteroides acidifaciens]|uniref:hypothetical protein n=1 Tax=Bacteroides acidifaciens TaxID=85831 RepID=UPI0026EA382D|nr:hypothetical protein [Bacteroides acidifaciens]
MDVHNNLYVKCLNGTSGVAEVLTAYDKGLIPAESVPVLMDVVPDCSIETLRTLKSNEFSYFCTKNIEAGIDVEMSDGSVEHFSLTNDDQLNILRNITNALMGLEELEYHADGCPQKTYNVEDMNRIYSTMQAKVNSETTYRNNLREWIQKIEDFDTLFNVKYGAEIPEEHWTEGWRNIQTRVARAIEAKENPSEPETSEVSEPEALSDTTENEGIVSKVVNAVTKKKTRKKKAETE